MSISTQRMVQVLAASALALGLAACGPNDGQTAGQKLDNSIERTEQAAENARMEADRAASSAGQAIENAADNAVDATRNAANDALNVANEAGITAKVNAALVGDAELSALKINVDTHGTAVTLNGEAPNQAAKDRAEQLAKAVEGVTSVNNLLNVK